MNPLKDKKILLGITGSIAAYKAAEIASSLTKSGAIVNAVLTPGGEKFITPLTLHSVTGRHASVDKDLWEGEQHVTHIELGHNSDLIVIAPASADFIAKITHGFGDSLLALAVLAGHCPVLVAPAMDGDMYLNQATQENIAQLMKRDFQIIGPASGHLASGLVGVGRMSDPQEILGAIRYTLSRGGILKNKKILVTAGGTQEAIDPVRIISNRSSGKQGYAIAQAALDLGADVTLITTVTTLPIPYGCKVVYVKSAKEMQNAIFENLTDINALIMCAAVADFRPEVSEKEKIKKDGSELLLRLEPTEDILLEVAKKRYDYTKLNAVIGFAAESENLIKNAENKLNKKKLDMIVANDISGKESGFESDKNQACFLFPDGSKRDLPLMGKDQLAELIMEEITKIIIKQ
ncbi:MAG TPA: bifunctional phosphopantothenoylcysteine decarboxylase/phosphopantothenate--cysteine ligase CoaBC [Flexilinea sp.]|jgi:phosphopantothenoylcysteine decarboxylase/phosphopantothenate--cysteine ligase|nr:bifunctional phosphopantothenoylcysteine decarboxylase/phosphopantothenate--cysteine ligase CoaBC [Flexilinea sp.]HPJ64338.1 bifunctional phosphopantothenoylcysteine decarboxylase/phosphopantothenate--cysteine ligase CoaBC [Flexilinea sp.]HPR70615.1 bifunctional phosphopantothenoylcysteine decarboxylase/phosphopantothenate--cysteine ligase CoaBC [Flexilinea sp.]HQF79175.1 bifunctional phosphopantothenoylcysteine decarboxylase/phosphopantothenate--cysteine ligase CoaBC [Flexilinea sp.]